MYPNSRGRNGDNNINGKENKVKRILTKDDINLLTKRSIEIRSEIQDLANLSSSLLELDKKLQSDSVVTDEKQESSYHVGGRDVFDYNFTIKNKPNVPITKIFEINERLVDLNYELSNVNEEIVRSLQNLNEKYEKGQEFINIAAHEIRNPCQAIIGYTELINLEPVNSKRYLDLITINAERLDLLISNILDASRIDNKTLSLKREKVDLVKLIEQIIDDINIRNTNEKNKNSRVIFENTLLSELDGDPNDDANDDANEEDRTIITDADIGRITQVMFNLLDNAIRFSKGSNVTITLRKSDPMLDKGIRKVTNLKNDEYSRCYGQEHDYREIIVQVKDLGKGINSEISDKLFSKFTSDLASGGTGLGLFISKNIIEAHGGKIWAENNQNEKGATFSFSLPLCSD